MSRRLGRILGVYVELGANRNAKNRWCGRSFLLFKVPQCPEDLVDWGCTAVRFNLKIGAVNAILSFGS